MDGFLKTCCGYIPHRYIVTALTSATLMVCYLNFNAAMASIAQLIITVREEREDESECPNVFVTDTKKPAEGGLYWNTVQLDAFFQTHTTGTLVAFIPAGMLADYAGAKIIVTIALAINSILTLLSPVLITSGAVLYLAACFFMGMTQGMLRVCSAVTLARWIPHTERATCSGIINSGLWIGWSLGYLVSRASLWVARSWETPFFLSGFLGLCVLLFWLMFASNQPADNPYVSADEMNFLLDKIEGFKQEISRMWPFAPWKNIMTSPPVLALILLNSFAMWIQSNVIVSFSTYFTKVTRLPKNSANGIITLADMIVVPATIFWGVVCDSLVNHFFISRTDSRKIFGFLSLILPVVVSGGISLVGCSGEGALFLYMLTLYFHSPYYSVMQASIVDISPQHAGVLMGLDKCIIQIVFSISNDLFSAIVKKPSVVSSWRILFVINVALGTLCSLPYLLFGSAQVQPWNYFVGRRRNVSNGSTLPRDNQPTQSSK